MLENSASLGTHFYSSRNIETSLSHLRLCCFTTEGNTSDADFWRSWLLSLRTVQFSPSPLQRLPAPAHAVYLPIYSLHFCSSQSYLSRFQEVVTPMFVEFQVLFPFNAGWIHRCSGCFDSYVAQFGNIPHTWGRWGFIHMVSLSVGEITGW